MLDDSGLVADNGTTMMLQPHYFGPGVGKLIILNDGDFMGGAKAGINRPPTLVNRGRIAKRGQGLTEIRGQYFGNGKISGDAGGNGADARPAAQRRAGPRAPAAVLPRRGRKSASHPHPGHRRQTARGRRSRHSPTSTSRGRSASR